MSDFGLRLRSPEGFIRFDSSAPTPLHIIKSGSYIGSAAPFMVPGLGALLASGKGHISWSSDYFDLIVWEGNPTPVYQSHVVGDWVYPPNGKYTNTRVTYIIIGW